MLLGNIRGALRVLSQTPSGGVLSLSAHVEINGEQRRVFDILKDKHPQSPAPAHPDALVNEALAGSPLFHPVLFEQITGDTIRSAALRTEGSAWPSGIDATGWRRMCTAFHGASTSLCNALAVVTRRLCTDYVDPTPLYASIQTPFFFYPTNVNWQLDQTKKNTAQPRRGSNSGLPIAGRTL